jgi:hypothetical protein
MKQLFRRRNEVVFGRKSADQVERRFGTAVSEVMERLPGDAAIVTPERSWPCSLAGPRGGSVALWTGLGMPSSVTTSWPQLELLDGIESYD